MGVAIDNEHFHANLGAIEKFFHQNHAQAALFTAVVNSIFELLEVFNNLHPSRPGGIYWFGDTWVARNGNAINILFRLN